MTKNMDVKILLIALSLIIGSCGKDCLFTIASDQLRFADTMEKGDKIYHLYTRTTGWHEKVVYLELYEETPTYDACTNKTDPEPIFGIHYDYFPNDPTSKEKYVKDIILQPEDLEKIKITYTPNKDEGFASVYDVKFTR